MIGEAMVQAKEARSVEERPWSNQATSDFKCTGFSTIKTVLASSLKAAINLRLKLGWNRRAENVPRQPITVAREAAANREKVLSPLESKNTRV
jgi:hypothetical protein